MQHLTPRVDEILIDSTVELRTFLKASLLMAKVIPPSFSLTLGRRRRERLTMAVAGAMTMLLLLTRWEPLTFLKLLHEVVGAHTLMRLQLFLLLREDGVLPSRLLRHCVKSRSTTTVLVSSSHPGL